MFRICLGLLLASAMAHADGWKLAWSDEFNGPEIDASIWGYEIGYKRNQELQYYSNRRENARIDSGHLLIRALKDDWQGHDYTSASLITSGKKSFQYGKFEMRARIDTRAGSWPAWWWLPNSGGWPRGGEIDMMEFYQGKCLFNVMDGNQKWYSETRTVASLGASRWSERFHVWTMDWDSTRIDLSLDGVLVNRFSLANADGTGPNGSNPFRRPGYLIVNQALGGTNGGDPANTTFPIDLRVDWIRVYAWSNETAFKLTVTGGSGSGDYVTGERASLVAQMPPAGQVFDRWRIDSGAAQIEDPNSENTRITLGNSSVTVSAIYRNQATNTITRHFKENTRKLRSWGEASTARAVKKTSERTGWMDLKWLLGREGL
jgi:beta-glucanase (GH16 family)